MLENAQIKKIGQNIKYDYCVFKSYNITLQGIAYDTMLESYILNSNATRHDMDSLALKYLGYKPISYEDVAGKGRNNCDLMLFQSIKQPPMLLKMPILLCNCIIIYIPFWMNAYKKYFTK